MTVYKCVNRKCKKLNQEFFSKDLAEYHAAGQWVRTPCCMDIAKFVRKVEIE